MIVETIQQKQKGIPKNISKLLIRAAILFIGWHLLYNYVIQPWGLLDHWLTQVTLSATVKMLSLFFNDVQQTGNSILIGGKPSINIADACNGLELIALYLGYFILLPANWKKVVIYSSVGIIVIMFLNVVRCALLAYLYQHDISAAEFAHKYAFKLAVYAFVFVAWVHYNKNMNYEKLKG